MTELFNRTQNVKLLTDLQIPKTLQQKAKGLIGCKSLPEGTGVWLKKCAWIHTFFMSIPIDVVYLDANLKIKKLQENLQPWRIPLPVLGAESVIEMSAGTIEKTKLQLGDELNVGH